MAYFLQNIISAYNFINFHFDRLSRPSSKYIPDKIQLELVHKRNKAYVLIELMITFFFFLNWVFDYGTPSTNLQGVFATLFIITVFFFSCSYHPEIFRVAYNIVNFSYVYGLTQHGHEGAHGAWLCVQSFPNLVYLFTGSLFHFIINVIIQTICLNTTFQRYMEKSVQEMDPPAFVRNLTYYSNQAIMLTVFAVIITHFILKNAYIQIAESEKKKEDLQRQKNFLLGFSHELRNLINSLMGNVKLAALEPLSDKVKDLLANAEVCSELLLHLVNNILDTGKVEIGDLEINPTPIKFYDIMERVWSVCSELIRRKNLTGRMRIKNNIPKILTLDHYRLTQIFLNLIGNAVKYTDIGGVDVIVEWIANKELVDDKCFEPCPFVSGTEDQEEGVFEKSRAFSVFDSSLIILNFFSRKINRALLKPVTDLSKGILKVTVSDTGSGIDPGDIGKLFKRFTQVSSDQSKRKLGTGLGLFITKELCERMNGQVRVFSKPGKGSAFTFCLPVEPASEQASSLYDLELIKKVMARRKLKAMIVDDQPMSNTIITNFLNKLGVEVCDVALNGLIAYETFLEREKRRELPQIITMDLEMPEMDGKQAAAKIRKHEFERKINPCFLVIISGNCSESEIKECLDKKGEIKADAFLKKPTSVDELCRVISAHFIKPF